MNSVDLKSLALEFSTDFKKSSLKILDQTLLPHQEIWIEIQSTAEMIDAIKKLQVRGAPLIGVAAALNLAQSALENFNLDLLAAKADALYAARPTAVNLMNCIDRMKKNLLEKKDQVQFIQTALDLFSEDVDLCEKISNHGATLINDGDNILTHCNTGGLATAGVGTALGIIRKAHESGKKIHVYVDETRPLLQGGRLTTWELQKINIPCTLITDNMAAHLMSLRKIDKVFVGSDRIAANGDFANKIGTYSVAVNCFYHKIPFYVAAPFTTVDTKCESGKNIPIEQRTAIEVRGAQGSFKDAKGSLQQVSSGALQTAQWAPENVNVYNPSFDVTPAELTTAWVMDAGIFKKEDITKGCFS